MKRLIIICTIMTIGATFWQAYQNSPEIITQYESTRCSFDVANGLDPELCD